jgi:hypothetical protein
MTWLGNAAEKGNGVTAEMPCRNGGKRLPLELLTIRSDCLAYFTRGELASAAFWSSP